MKNILITGCSQGIGFDLALFLKDKGFNVIASMRNLSNSNKLKEEAGKIKNGNLDIFQIDVDNVDSVNKGISEISEKYKTIDVLVNNAGYGIAGPIEDISEDEIRSQYNTNVFGVVRVIKAIVPIMREMGHGRIINISSGLANVSLPMLGTYSSTKWALEAISESLYYELSLWNIDVVVIQPGQINTEFSKSSLKVSQKTLTGQSVYQELSSKVKDMSEKRCNKLNTLPITVSKVIYKAIVAKKPKFRYRAGKDSKQLAFARKILPDKLIMKIFKKAMS